MKGILLILGMIMFTLMMSNATWAAWCVTVTDNICNDTDWGRTDYTIPQDANVITIRYETGDANCCVDIQIWAMENNPPTLEGEWLGLCNCGVVTFDEPWNTGHVLRFAVKCYTHPDYTGPAYPCELGPHNAKFFWPSNHVTCNTACIPD